MRAKNTKSLLGQAMMGATVALGSLLVLSAHAAAPGITGPTSGSNSSAHTFLRAVSSALMQNESAISLAVQTGIQGYNNSLL